MNASDIQKGRVYRNGVLLRKVVTVSAGGDTSATKRVTFERLNGPCKGACSACSLKTFIAWAEEHVKEPSP